VNPDAFDAPAMQEEAESFLDWVKQSPQSGEAPIQVPGEWEEQNRVARERDGIPLDSNSWEQICDAALQAGMPQEELAAFRALTQ